jgi:hypothetical protein
MLDRESGMTRKLLTIGTGVALAVLASNAWAGPNDGPKYPNSTTNKQYQDQRIMDHNNAAPRYAVTAAGKQYQDQRIMDHNNAAPRYPVAAAAAGQAGNQNARALNTTPRYAVRRHVPRATHAARTSVHHG